MLKKKITKKIIFIFGIFLGLAVAFSLGAYAESMQSSAVYYDNSTSGGSSNTVSGALDELYEKAKSCSISGDCLKEGSCFKDFTKTSWADIANDVRSGNASIYKVGDTKTIDMGSLGTHTLRVANTSACTNGETSKTTCGFVVEFADIITTSRMNTSERNVGGWPASEMRTYVNGTIYNALPSDLQSVLANTTVVSSRGLSDSSNFTSTDKLYLLAPKEIYSDWDSNSNSQYDTAKDTTRQLEYYKNQGVTTSSESAAIKQYNGSNTVWWLRSAYSSDFTDFFVVSTSGSFGGNSANYTRGVAPAFRIE